MQMKKTVLLLTVTIFLISTVFIGCSRETDSKMDSSADKTSTEVQTDTISSKTDDNKLTIGLMLPALDSPNWQKISKAAQDACTAYEGKNGIKINLLVQGPAGEAESEKYIATLENLVASEDLDGLIVSSLYPDPVAPIVQQASEMGIWVNLYAFNISGSEDNWHSIWLANSYDSGVYAAQGLAEAIKAKGLPENGKVALFMSVVNDAGELMFQGLKEELPKLLPEIEILDIQYNENDVNKAIAQMENTMSTYGNEIVGIYAGNNTTGTALARIIEEGSLSEKVATVALDADTEEVAALEKGSLDALIVRPDYITVYNMMFDTIDSLLNGTEHDKQLYCEYAIVTKNSLETADDSLLIDLYPEKILGN